MITGRGAGTAAGTEPEFNITPKSLRPLRLLRPLNVAEQEADQLRQRVAELERELRHEQINRTGA